ncbi:MAG: hypothetical protein AB7U36_04950 [Desulfobacter sp.]
MPLSIIEYLERGPSTSKEIQAATGLSQTTIARKIGLPEDQRGIVIEAAYEFWERVSMDSKISDPFGAYLQEGNPVEHLISTRK